MTDKQANPDKNSPTVRSFIHAKAGVRNLRPKCRMRPYGSVSAAFVRFAPANTIAATTRHAAMVSLSGENSEFLNPEMREFCSLGYEYVIGSIVFPLLPVLEVTTRGKVCAVGD